MTDAVTSLFVHVEEPSMAAAAQILCGRLGYRPIVIDHGSKHRLLRDLPTRMKGYRHFVEPVRVMVLVDRDSDDCRVLKQCLEDAAALAGMPTKTAVRPGDRFAVVNRIVIEELEAWFLGDRAALCAAYPRLPSTLTNRSRYRDPDAVPGGTWEALDRALKRAGYFVGAPMPKIEVARSVATHMNVGANRSRSFQVFVEGLRALCAQ